ncbi:putative G-patch domain protein [Aspergillus clavatus NRRL 1]|uniref:G-patch domain protein, putative n=1 Tax=Aspergillus clavatus (strain ATCC 1007 / CBS 513.65 / DSM 816 / NCTC 3887 / NRRL 1 / QM 1276 / 107) TaxID=344612 RepID=A1C3V9_ASPCL|nr:G-patch domain protein, putative [Aspergillus clavatus NRRL 1]EAW15099.1 G-patch domain protein, putative [Aspergillus clavatus NRRL 1]
MPPHGSPAQEDEEDDYMSMVIEEPQQKETFAQKKLRKQREAEARAKVPSKAERAAEEAARREAALSTSTLNPANKGFRMMAKLGFKPGQTLGKPQAAPEDESQPERVRSEPLNLVFKEGRGGIGLDSEKKRKFREEAEEAVKKIKQEEGDYRDRVRQERETRRTEAQVHAAQKVAERLDAEAEMEAAEEVQPNAEGSPAESPDPVGTPGPARPKVKVKPTSQINILYRGLVREREEKERSLQARHALQTSLPSSFFPTPQLPGYDDSTLERDDQQALGAGPDTSTILEQELEEEDPELDEFNALEPSERLARLVQYLREKYRYCFWCKYRYETDAMEGCPGITEEDHD